MPVYFFQRATRYYLRAHIPADLDPLFQTTELRYSLKTADLRQARHRIESFWAFAKSRLTKFHGIADSTFYLHLKECEFRFNYRDKDLYKMLIKMLKEKPLF